ncbi:unnamed protein product [Vitrella brassicaformis CCMP3155]|uniref:Sushi domain-containing protein n=2 Tax=Vitrella brassicaformis TaxID=1169539 RepID=A0A0G4H295_VITBC|nr:unnamed protein product [Vitrella brassicaformis CCMP3155]|eukprot:CEM37760.1 unnamed protein product [Vitrella brassicaformis CCMP3155]
MGSAEQPRTVPPTSVFGEGCTVLGAEVFTLLVPPPTRTSGSTLPYTWEDKSLGKMKKLFDGEGHPPSLVVRDDPLAGQVMYLRFNHGKYFSAPKTQAGRLCVPLLDGGSGSFTLFFHLAINTPPQPGEVQTILDGPPGFRIGFMAAYDQDGDPDPDTVYFGLLPDEREIDIYTPKRYSPDEGKNTTQGEEGAAFLEMAHNASYVAPLTMVPMCWRQPQGNLYAMAVELGIFRLYRMGLSLTKEPLSMESRTWMGLQAGPSTMSLGCDKNGQKCFKGVMRLFHYSNKGHLGSSTEDAAANFFDLLSLRSFCGNGKVDGGTEECDVQATPDTCSCSCRLKCPPYVNQLTADDTAHRYLASLPDVPGSPTAEKYLHRGFEHSTRLMLTCRNAGGAANVTEPSYHGDVTEGRDMVLCGNERSGQWTQRTMDCLQDCDPVREKWWNMSDVGGGSTYRLEQPKRPTRIHSGEEVRIACNPDLPTRRGAPTQEVLSCFDGYIDPLGLPCKPTCPRDIMMPPSFSKQLNNHYSVEGEGYQEGSKRVLTCRDGYAPPVGTPFLNGRQEIDCYDGEWQKVLLECRGMCSPFKLPTETAHRYHTDPPLGQEERRSGATVQVWCLDQYQVPEGQHQPQTVECTCYGDPDQCETDDDLWQWSSFHLECAGSCQPYQPPEPGVRVQYFNAEGNVPKQVEYGAEIQLSCDERQGWRTMVSADKDTEVLKCVGDQYTIKSLVCYGVCTGEPDIPEQGVAVQVTGDVAAPYRHGTTRVLSCMTGYSIEDETNMPIKDLLLCSNGQWTERQLACRADCPRPPHFPDEWYMTKPLSQADLAAKAVHRHGEKITVVCRETGMEQVLSCLDGKWTELALPCAKRCPVLTLQTPPLRKGEATFSANDVYVVEPKIALSAQMEHASIVTLRCNRQNGFHSVSGGDVDFLACNNGKWSLQMLVCGRKWHIGTSPHAHITRTSPSLPPSLNLSHHIGDCTQVPAYLLGERYVITAVARRASSLDPNHFPQVRALENTEAAEVVVTDKGPLGDLVNAASHPHGTRVRVQCNVADNYVPQKGTAAEVAREEEITCDRVMYSDLPMRCNGPCGRFPSLPHQELYPLRPLPEGELDEPQHQWHGTQVEVRCDRSRGATATPAAFEGSVSVCSNGTWSPFPPLVTCNIPCDKYVLGEGITVVGFVPDPPVPHRTEIKVRCETEVGYYNLTGENPVATVMCTNGNYTAPIPELFCRRQCKDLKAVVDAVRYGYTVVESLDMMDNQMACSGDSVDPFRLEKATDANLALSAYPRHGSCAYSPDVDSSYWRKVGCGDPREGPNSWKEAYGVPECDTLRCVNGIWTPPSFNCRADCPNPFKKERPMGVTFVDITQDKPYYHEGEQIHITCKLGDNPFVSYTAISPARPSAVETLTCDDGYFPYLALRCRRRCEPYVSPYGSAGHVVTHTRPASDTNVDDIARAYQDRPSEMESQLHAVLVHFNHKSRRYIECAERWSDPDWHGSQGDLVECQEGKWTRQEIRCRKQCPSVAFYSLDPTRYKVTYVGRDQVEEAMAARPLPPSATPPLYPSHPLGDVLVRDPSN